MLVSADLRILRLLRLMRLVRLVKITRYLRQPRADEGSLRELLDLFQRQLAGIRVRLTADQERDLTRRIKKELARRHLVPGDVRFAAPHLAPSPPLV